ncbi:MAG: CDP-diacylglycerol--serine O-phosphatidyltransferase [Nitrospinota bacterium]
MQEPLRDRFRGRFRRRRRRGRGPLRRGVFLLPNLLTTGSLFLGFYAIIASIQGNHGHASLAILIAIVLDGMDGTVARLTKSASPFGLQYDSLCDLTAFGLAPAVLIYNWALAPFGRFGWLAAFVFAACGALRLARFNVLALSGEGASDFRGLPIPAAAGVLASTVYLAEDLRLQPFFPHAVIAAAAYLLAFLMVSTLRYRGFKNLGGPLRHPFRVLVGAVLALFVAAAAPQVVAFALTVGYAASGPLSFFARMRRLKERRPQEGETSPPAP